MNKLRRTQIYLPEDQVLLLRERARGSRSTMSEVIREALTRYLTPGLASEGRSDPIDTLVGKFNGGPADLSTRVDDYLYGPARKLPVGKPGR